MPRKPLDALKGAHTVGCWAGGFLPPAQMPHGECGAWGRAPEGVSNRGDSMRLSKHPRNGLPHYVVPVLDHDAIILP
jgi:hypothetical protein